MKMKTGHYKWTGVANPNRCWWQFWKPRKANMLLTFHYFVDAHDDLHIQSVNLEIKYG